MEWFLFRQQIEKSSGKELRPRKKKNGGPRGWINSVRKVELNRALVTMSTT